MPHCTICRSSRESERLIVRRVTALVARGRSRAEQASAGGEVVIAPAYDRMGIDYSEIRRADPRFEAAIWDALGDAKSVLNVGAGAGTYEPRDREVLAVEPVRAIDYGRPSDRSVAGMLRERRGTCSTKHLFLAASLTERFPETQPQIVHRVYRLDRDRAGELFGAEAAAAVPDEEIRSHEGQNRVHYVVEGFLCSAVLAETEVTCRHHKEWIFASTQPTDHPGEWHVPHETHRHPYWRHCAPVREVVKGDMLTHRVGCTKGRKVIRKVLRKSQTAQSAHIHVLGYTCGLRPYATRPISCRKGGQRILSPLAG
jgi:hypothetical protein